MFARKIGLFGLVGSMFLAMNACSDDSGENGNGGGNGPGSGGSSAASGGSSSSTAGSSASTGGSSATTGGSSSATGGSSASTGGSSASTGGSSASTGGSSTAGNSAGGAGSGGSAGSSNFDATAACAVVCECVYDNGEPRNGKCEPGCAEIADEGGNIKANCEKALDEAEFPMCKSTCAEFPTG